MFLESLTLATRSLFQALPHAWPKLAQVSSKLALIPRQASLTQLSGLGKLYARIVARVSSLTGFLNTASWCLGFNEVAVVPAGVAGFARRLSKSGFL